ncbi:unnamed protein product [Boreogadus saida]
MQGTCWCAVLLLLTPALYLKCSVLRSPFWLLCTIMPQWRKPYARNAIPKLGIRTHMEEVQTLRCVSG